MSGTPQQVVTCNLVSALIGQAVSARPLEKEGKRRNFLKPVDQLIFGLGLGNAGLNGPTAQRPENEPDQPEEHSDKKQKRRMIKSQENHPRQGPENQVHTIQEQQGRAFLGGNGIQKAIYQLRRVNVVQSLGLHARQSVSEIRGDPDEDPPLQYLGNIILECTDDRLQGETREKGDTENHQGLDVRPRLTPKS